MDEHEPVGRMSSGPVEPGATISSPAGGDPAADETAQERAELSRRNFVLRALAFIGGGIAAAMGIPVIGFTSAPGWQARAPIRLLSTSIVPTLRSSALTSVGRVADFEVSVPRYVKVDRPIVDGWVAENAPVGVHVVRTSETDVTAFDPHCTHLGCPLAWSPGAKSFLCPCHGGSFNSDGDVIAGPPPSPMIRYEIQVQDGEVFVGALQEGA